MSAYRWLVAAPLLLAGMVSFSLTPAQAAPAPKVAVATPALSPRTANGGAQVTVSARVTGPNVTEVTARTLPASGVAASEVVTLTVGSDGRTYSGQVTVPANPTRRPVTVKAEVKALVANRPAVVKRGGSLRINPEPPAPLPSLLSLAYHHVSDSDGGKPGPGVDVSLVFEPNGIAQVYVARADDAIARRGTYSYKSGKLTLKFTDSDFKPNVTFALDLRASSVKMPFKVFSTSKGTSTWQRAQPHIVQQINAIFTGATINEDLKFDAAIARVEAYVNARIALENAALRATSSAQLVGLAEPPARKLKSTARLKNGVKLIYTSGPAEKVILFGWANSKGVPLTPGPLATDPRMNFDVVPTSGAADPTHKKAVFIAPFHTQRTISWYDAHFRTGVTDIRSQRMYHFGTQNDDNLGEMQGVLESKGYTVQKLTDADVSPLGIIQAVSDSPGLVYFSTHGDSEGTLVTNTYLGGPKDSDADLIARYTAEIDQVESAGFQDVVRHKLTPEGALTTFEVVWVKRNLEGYGSSAFLGITPNFWDALRAKRGVNFSKSLVYIAACDTDNTSDLREAIKAKAYFGFRGEAPSELAGAIFQYLIRHMARRTHSAEEAYYNVIRIANTRQMIYIQDRLDPGRQGEDFLFHDILPEADRNKRVVMDMFRGYGFDGEEVVPYQITGWMTQGMSDFDPGAVFWLLFGGRWGKDAQQGNQALLRCWNQWWSQGKTGGLADPDAQNRSPGRPATQKEVYYASYLLSGQPVVGGNLFKLPRWTLNDSN